MKDVLEVVSVLVMYRMGVILMLFVSSRLCCVGISVNWLCGMLMVSRLLIFSVLCIVIDLLCELVLCNILIW